MFCWCSVEIDPWTHTRTKSRSRHFCEEIHVLLVVNEGYFFLVRRATFGSVFERKKDPLDRINCKCVRFVPSVCECLVGLF